MKYQEIPSDEIIRNVVATLKANGINALIAENQEEAKIKALELIPEGSEVMTMTSITLETVGLESELNESSKYDSVKAKLSAMDRNTQSREMQRLGAAPEYSVGSVHAVTQNGEVVIASNTGSQLPAYVYGADKVIWVVGAQKIVSDKDEAIKRIYEYVLPLESERAKKAYGVEGSFVSKILTINKEVNPERLHLIIVKELLGY